jgi:hypothetical protein
VLGSSPFLVKYFSLAKSWPLARGLGGLIFLSDPMSYDKEM